MPQEPKSRPESGRPAAERQFVDREEFVAPVQSALKEPPRTKPLVLVFHGGAGIGKSRLRRELVRQLARDPEVLTATLDFDVTGHRHPESAFFFLRRTLGEVHQVRFPSFDIAYAILWQKGHPETRLGDDVKPLLDPGSLLSQLLDDSGRLPLIGLIPRIAKLLPASLDPSTTRPLDHFLSDWWTERGERELEDIPQMEPGAIVEQLPKLWAADLREFLAHRSSLIADRRAVLFIDSYEKLWDIGRTEADLFKRDEWVRELVTQLPEVLWVICGRQKLRWEEKETDWGKALSQHQLQALPEQSARRFLESCDIPTGQIQDAIVKGSQGVPHYLDLAVDAVQNAEGKSQNAEFGGGSPEELVEQFTQRLDKPEVETLKVLSAARFWYYGLFEHLITRYQTGYPLTGYDDLARFSFVKEGAAPGTRTMHELMREALQEAQSPELRKRVHLFLHEIYAKQLEGLDAKNISDKHKAALTEAFFHGRQAMSAQELWAWFDPAAEVFREARQNRVLLPLCREMAHTLEAELGPNHADLATALCGLAGQLHYLGECDEAEQPYRRALALREKLLGPEHPEVAQTLRYLASMLEFQDRFAEAEPLLRRALAIRRKVLGPDHPDMSDSLIGLARLLRAQAKSAEAEPLCRRSLAIAQKAHGPEHPRVSDGLYELATTLYMLGKYVEAEPLFRRALAIREKTLGPMHPSTANAVEKLAVVSDELGRYAEAELLYRRALAIYEKTFGPDNYNVARTLDNLALMLQPEGRYTEAEPLTRRSLAIMEKVLGPEHSETARIMGNLAHLLLSLGRYADSEPLGRRALAIMEKGLGPEHPSAAYCLRTVSRAVAEQGRYTEAEPLMRRALAIWEKGLGPDHAQVAYGLNALSMLLGDQRKYAEAEPLARRALAIWEKGLGADHPNVAAGLDTLSVLLGKQRKYAEAEPLVRRALAIWEKELGPDNPDVAWGLDTLSVLLSDQGRHGEAEPLARRALAIREAKFGPNHPLVAKTLDVLAKVCEKTDRAAEAQELAARAHRIRVQAASASS